MVERIGIPTGRKLGELLASIFRQQSDEVIRQLQRRQLDLPARFTLAQDWTDRITTAAQPILQVYYDRSAKSLWGRVGADPDQFAVVNRKILDAVKQAALDFAQSTVETTSKDLSDALDQLRVEMAQGLLVGDPIKALAERVRGVFEDATTYRATRIAQTEASRAVHAGLVMAAADSGVVKGWRWVLSPDACEICIAIAEANPEIPIGGTFAMVGADPTYARVGFPPAHPHCRCTMEEILDIERNPKAGQVLAL